MPDDLVRWNDFHLHFEILFPETVAKTLQSGKSHPITYLGVRFEIRPRPGNDFDVYGPAFFQAQ